MINDKIFINNNLLKEFNNYLMRGYRMRDQKEILIQDLGDEREIRRYNKFNVYRRDITYGTPLYFAPYFTRNKRETEGISKFSKILGIITARPNDINGFIDNLKEFSKGKDDSEEFIKKWRQGIKLDKDNIERTYYLLDDPVILNKALLKDNKNSKGWIAHLIPKNRCVGFDEFVKRIMII
jgi:hypothetical protein